MPPVAKRRKILPSVNRPVTAPAAQRSIQAFGKISKSQALKHGKGIFGKNGIDTESRNACSSENIKKRKLDSTCTDKEEESSIGKQAQSIVDSSSQSSTASARNQTSAFLEKAFLPKNDIATPTKAARSYLESLALASSPPSNSSSPSPATEREKGDSFNRKFHGYAYTFI